jgi:uncharacterized damage-inducible protein DinB
MTTLFTLDALREMLRHMEWADATVWRAVMAHPASAEDTRMRELLMHVHAVQRAFLEMGMDRELTPPPAAAPELATIHERSRAYYVELAAWLDTLRERDLARVIEMPWLSQYEQQTGQSFARPTLGEALMQVTSHSTYHRGQVNARLREIGGEPPLVDYVAWIWFGKPPAPSA